MPSIAFIEAQLRRERERQQRAKADSDLKDAIRSAVREVLAEAGVVAAPQPKAPAMPALSPRMTRWTRPVRDYTPPPEHAPQPQIDPAPAPPAPLTLPEFQIERNELGDLVALSGPAGRLTVRRNHVGLIDTVFLNGRPLTKFVRGFDGRIVKLEPPKGARP